jgi:DNA-binding transcriptional LysR family regulator
MTLAQLKAFLTVVETGSFTNAALELDTVQSAVSYAITELERELGVKLLVRGRFGAHPTDLGKEIAVNARQMLQLHAAIEQQASLAKGTIKSSLRIATFRSVASKIMPDLMAELSRQYPQLTLQLVEMDCNSSGIEQALRDGRVEAAFVVAPFSDDFLCWELIRDPYVALLPQRGDARRESTIGRHELAGYGLILYEDENCVNKVQNYLGDVGLSVQPAYQVKEDSTILSLVSKGLGRAVVPSLTVERLPHGVQVAQLEDPLERVIGIAIRPGSLKTPAVRVFLKALRERFPAAGLPDMTPTVQVQPLERS